MADAGHVKRHNITGAVAVRTRFPADHPRMGLRAWQIATTDIGGMAATDAEITADENWVDLFVPELPEVDES